MLSRASSPPRRDGLCQHEAPKYRSCSARALEHFDASCVTWRWADCLYGLQLVRAVAVTERPRATLEPGSVYATQVGTCGNLWPFPDPCWSTPNLARNSPGFYLLVMGPADGNDQAVDRDRSSRPDVVGYNYPEQPTRPSCWSMFRPGFSQILVLLPPRRFIPCLPCSHSQQDLRFEHTSPESPLALLDHVHAKQLDKLHREGQRMRH